MINALDILLSPDEDYQSIIDSYLDSKKMIDGFNSNI